MQHPHILPSHDMNQFARLNVPDLDEARLEGENIGIMQCKALGSAFPLNLPIGSCPPPVTVDKETKVRVIQEELAIQPLDVDGLDVLLAGDEVE
jgi:hypothetical protein